MNKKYTPPVNQLLTYGDCQNMGHSPNEWPDYLELGFSEKDIPQLISMATDEELNWAYSDSLKIWAPTHAWRVLAQLRAVEAIKPLLHLASISDDEEWITEELPYVFGMIGEKRNTGIN